MYFPACGYFAECLTDAGHYGRKNRKIARNWDLKPGWKLMILFDRLGPRQLAGQGTVDVYGVSLCKGILKTAQRIILAQPACEALETRGKVATSW